MCTIRILILSNAPWNLSGYGTQALLLGRKLREHGHEVAFSAFHGLQGPAQGFDGFPVFGGSGEDAFNRDVLPAHYRYFGADLLITLLDAWAMDPSQLPGMNVACWMPVDCAPLSTRDKQVLAPGTMRPIAMSRIGQQLLLDAGYDPLYAPHSLDMTVWKPLDSRDERRQQLGMDGLFVVGINAANQDPLRKGFYEQLQAFRMFADRHGDARMVIHTRSVTGNGVHLDAMLAHLGLQGKVAVADQPAYATGLVNEAGMAEWHGMLDVLSNCSYGEGFGLATLQSQATGVPVVVTDWAASSELCGAGWKAEGQRWWNNGHDADWMVPFVHSIADAYEQAHEQAAGLREQAREFALQYDADLIYAEHWEAVLKELTPQ